MAGKKMHFGANVSMQSSNGDGISRQSNGEIANVYGQAMVVNTLKGTNSTHEKLSDGTSNNTQMNDAGSIRQGEVLHTNSSIGAGSKDNYNINQFLLTSPGPQRR